MVGSLVEAEGSGIGAVTLTTFVELRPMTGRWRIAMKRALPQLDLDPEA
ncbi:hypothetical protein Taro_008593 [Colocasia esculenta]|uniref:Uncharacterized protein n=1 Tax=Colocasia esculenta TaxID=4460 RepID=A0A843U3H0_COLES|nr:hypothetical protein [Colocasia esculenta]